jgi:hypothetical protein
MPHTLKKRTQGFKSSSSFKLYNFEELSMGNILNNQVVHFVCSISFCNMSQ